MEHSTRGDHVSTDCRALWPAENPTAELPAAPPLSAASYHARRVLRWRSGPQMLPANASNVATVAIVETDRLRPVAVVNIECHPVRASSLAGPDVHLPVPFPIAAPGPSVATPESRRDSGAEQVHVLVKAPLEILARSGYGPGASCRAIARRRTKSRPALRDSCNLCRKLRGANGASLYHHSAHGSAPWAGPRTCNRHGAVLLETLP